MKMITFFKINVYKFMKWLRSKINQIKYLQMRFKLNIKHYILQVQTNNLKKLYQVK